MEIIKLIIMLLFLVPASIIDNRTNKIPNYISFSFITMGFLWCLMFDTYNIWSSLLAVIGLFFFGMFGLMGIGDIKLLMGISLYCGYKTMLLTVMISLLLLALTEFILAPKKTVIVIRDVFIGKLSVYDGNKKPFSVYILFGLLISFIFNVFI